MNAPVRFFYKKVLDMTDLAVVAVDMVSDNLLDAAKMRIIVTPLRSGYVFVTPIPKHGVLGFRP